MKRSSIVFIVLVFLLVGASVSQSQASSNILFIMDSSGSMAGKVDDSTKMATAKQVLKSLLADLPKDTNVGLMAYGHRNEGDCKDVEVLTPINPNDPTKLAASIDSLQPKGKTPLTYSLGQTLPLFVPLKGENNIVVLVSDGEETCDGDPCAAAKKLAAAGVNLKIHVVGFDVSATERKQLECIAEKGKGKYFNAENAKGLEKALAEVKKEVVKPAPEPKKPQKKEYFFDDFEGDALKDHWEILNPNPDTFIVENSGLLVISYKPGDFDKESIENLFRLKKPLPEGDWIMTAKFTIDLQTGAERPFLGLYDNKDSYIVLHGIPWAGGNWGDIGNFAIEIEKNSRGRKSSFKKNIFSTGRVKGYRFSEAMKAMPQPLLFSLRKKGRSYFGAVMLQGAKEPHWVELEKITTLRAKGALVFGIYQSGKVSGETTAVIDWVKIESSE